MGKVKSIITALLTISILLVSCGGPTADYLNTPSYCQLGETIYRSYGMTLRRYSTAFPEGGSLCFDPLCTHKSICPESIGITHVLTDGRSLYLRGYALRTDENGNTSPAIEYNDGNPYMLNALYRLDNTNGEITKLVEFSTVNGQPTGFSTDGKYLYYVEAYYKQSDDGSYGIPKRVPVSGGKGEEFLDGDYTAYASIYADSDNYYILDDGFMTQINRDNTKTARTALPCLDYSGLVIHDGVYLVGIENTHTYEGNSRVEFERLALWHWNGETFEKLISDIGQLVWDDGGVWFTRMLPESEFVAVGTTETYNGKEMSLYDFVRYLSGELYYHDLTTGEVTAYNLGNPNLTVEPIGVSNGCIIAACNDLSEFDFNYRYLNLTPEPDGSISYSE